jgi:hypothetical protein
MKVTDDVKSEEEQVLESYDLTEEIKAEENNF